MKKEFLALLVCGVIVLFSSINSISSPPELEVKYRRSSLHLVLIDSGEFPKKETVVNTYNKFPFPDKYNDHTLPTFKTFNLNGSYSNEPRTVETRGGEPETRPADDSAPSGEPDDTKNAEIPVKINTYLRETKLANQLVAKWFNRNADGAFDMGLVQERGSYNATEMEADIAKGSARGMSSLSDAGEELIGNTFVVFSKLNFVENEPIARVIRDEAIAVANKLTNPIAQQVTITAANVAYNKTKDGYSVWTTSWLYKLQWNDSVAAIFYNDYWMDKSSIDPAKKKAFDESELFQMELVGSEKSKSLVLLAKDRSEEEVISLATVRNMDATLAKLQKKYDVFKPKVPLLTNDPLTAQIGMKEGLTGGEKFEVLEQTIDPKTGITKYVRVGTITVDKKLIWDNRYNAGTGPETPVDGEEPVTTTPGLDRTTFKGSSKLQPGMLIRLIK